MLFLIPLDRSFKPITPNAIGPLRGLGITMKAGWTAIYQRERAGSIHHRQQCMEFWFKIMWCSKPLADFVYNCRID